MQSIVLADKIVIVTGAGSGLGRAMALGLAAANAKVLALDVDLGRVRETEQAAKAAGASGQVMPIACDVRREAECARAVATARDELGGLTGLVNCAGLGMTYIDPQSHTSPPPFWKVDPQRWQDLMDVNVRGPFLLARAAIPHLIAQRWGRIVNVTTSMNTMIRGANMPYGQSKAALEAATNAWAEDTRGTGVTVNVLVPGGAADTPMIPQDSPYDRAKLVKPEVMVAPIRWLMSEQSDGVTAMRFIGRQWSPDASWQDAMAASGAGAAWPALAAAVGAAKPDGAGKA